MVETRLQLKRLRNNIYYRDIDYNEVVVMSTHPHQTKKKKKHHNNNNRREDKQMKAAARRQKKANQVSKQLTSQLTSKVAQEHKDVQWTPLKTPSIFG